MKPAILYFYDGTFLEMYSTPSGLAGSEEEFINRCLINPGLVEVERIARNELGENIFQGKYPSPLKCDMKEFEKKYGNIGGGRKHQIRCLIHGHMPTEFLQGIDIEYSTTKETNTIKLFLKNLFNMKNYEKI